MTDPSSFTPFAPGFEFLQGLVKNAGAAMPGMGQWVTPTLDPEELDKRIQDLRTVQFWLEQNARMLGATIQALEVQKMTLATLQTLNVQMGDLRDSLTIRRPAAAEPAAPEPESTPTASPPAPEPADAAAPAASADTAESKPVVVDPVQWWGALTKQFSELASSALKDGTAGLSAMPPSTRPPAAKKSTPATKARGAPTRPAASSPTGAARAPARKRAAASRKSTRP